jgi:predicted  nucleic acid-binding Zn-ribbon protein
LLPELSQLIDLHELDREILEVDQALRRLPEELQVMAREMAALEDEQASRVKELEDLQSQLQEVEAEVHRLEEGIKASRQRLMEIAKELELKAMLKEIAFREDQRDQKETRLLELLDLVEAKNQALSQKDQELRGLREEYNRRAREVAQQVAELEKQRAVLEEKRTALRAGLPPQVLKRYEFIRSRRNGSAIAEVRRGVCLACHMNILPQQFIDLQKGLELIQCPHCQRILYWLGEDEAEGEEQGLSRQAS